MHYRLNTLAGRSRDTRLFTIYGYARLVGYDRNFKLVPDLLESYEVDSERDEFEVAVRNFLALTVADRALATPHVYKNYLDFAYAVGPDDLEVEIDDPDEVWNHVHPRAVRVRRRHRREARVYVVVAAECDWEPEHGLQLVYRDGKELSRVSAQDGHVTWADAYDVPDDEDWVS